MHATVIGLLTRAAVFVVAVTSGVYVLVDLYRWEWHRALVAGVFFLAAELALLGLSIGSRLSRLEARVQTLADDLRTADRRPGPAGPLQEPSFPWLQVVTHGRDRHVFVPILLGSGAIVSALAYLVERMASAVSGTAAGTPPAGLRVPTTLTAPGPAVGAAPAATVRRHTSAALGALAALAVAAAGIVVLRDQTMSVPEQVVADSTAVVELSVERRRWGTPTEHLGAALWAECRLRLGDRFTLTEARVTGQDRMTWRITPAPPDGLRRRFVGCVQDASIDDVQAQVHRWDTVAAPVGRPGP